MGRVLTKIDDKSIANSLWLGSSHEKPWSLLIVMDKLSTLSIPRAVLNSKLGLAARFVPQGFSTLSEVRMKSLNDGLGNLGVAVRALDSRSKLHR